MLTLRRRLTALLCLPLLLSACSSTPGYFEAQQPTAGNSLLYLYRPKADNPGMQPLRFSYPDIQLDGRSVGQLPFNSHFAVGLSPGKHTLRVTGLSKNAKWEPRDIEQSFTVSAGEVKYMKLNVQYNLNEMNLGQPSPSYTLFLMPVRADDARYEIRNTSAVD